MSRRQIYIGIAGLVLGLIGLAALWFPVYLNQFDAYGMKIGCGNGIGSHIAATQVDGDAAARCGTALLVRRLWAIPTVVLGWLLVTVFLVMWAHIEQSLSTTFHTRRSLGPRRGGGRGLGGLPD